VDAALPATPQTLASEKDAMESDDEVQSMASSADMGMMEDEDSSVDFGANGKCISCWSCRVEMLTLR